MTICKDKYFKHGIITLIITMIIGTLPINISALNVWSLPNAQTAGSEEVYRFGLFSDSHVTTDTAKFSSALKAYKDMNIDDIAMVGDIVYMNKDVPSTAIYQEGNSDNNIVLSDYLFPSYYTALKNEMSSVWPANSDDTSQGKFSHWNYMYVTGNHEFSQNSSASRTPLLDTEAMSLFEQQMGQTQREHVILGGYHFIKAGGTGYQSYMTTENQQWLMQEIDNAIAEDASKPVFLLLHHPIHETAYGSNVAGDTRYSAEFKTFLESRPQIVNFTAHMHTASQDPKSIWQGETGFTVIQSPMLGGGYLNSGGTVENTIATTSQSLMVEVADNIVYVYRMDLVSGQYIGEPWIIDIPGLVAGTANRLYTDSRFANSATPEFPANATVTADNITNSSAKITFTQATNQNVGANQDGFVQTYKIKVLNSATGATVQENYYQSDYYSSSKPENMLQTITKTISGLSAGTQYTIQVYARNPFNKESAASISVSFTTGSVIEVLTNTSNASNLTVSGTGTGIGVFSTYTLIRQAEFNKDYLLIKNVNIPETGKYKVMMNVGSRTNSHSFKITPNYGTSLQTDTFQPSGAYGTGKDDAIGEIILPKGANTFKIELNIPVAGDGVYIYKMTFDIIDNTAEYETLNPQDAEQVQLPSADVFDVFYGNNSNRDLSPFATQNNITATPTYTQGSPVLNQINGDIYTLGLNGSSAYGYDFPTSRYDKMSTGFTIEATAYIRGISNTTKNCYLFSSLEGGGASLGYSPAGEALFTLYCGSGYVTLKSQCPLNAWMHIAGVFEYSADGTSYMKLYLNNKLKAIQIVNKTVKWPYQNSNVTGRKFFIGTDMTSTGTPDPSTYVKADVLSARIYGRPLSIAEIYKLNIMSKNQLHLYSYDYLSCFSGTNGEYDWYYATETNGSYKEMDTYTSGIWSDSADTNAKITSNSMELGDTANPVVWWVASNTGKIKISSMGKIRLAQNGGNTKLTVYTDNQTLWEGNISDTEGIDLSAECVIYKNQKLYFKLESGGTNTNSKTYFSPVIAFAADTMNLSATKFNEGTAAVNGDIATLTGGSSIKYYVNVPAPLTYRMILNGQANDNATITVKVLNVIRVLKKTFTADTAYIDVDMGWFGVLNGINTIEILNDGTNEINLKSITLERKLYSGDENIITVPGGNYNPGGQNVGFYETSNINTGYDNGDIVDINTGGNSSFAPGEWQKYDLELEKAARYYFVINAGTTDSTYAINVYVNDKLALTKTMPGSGAYGTKPDDIMGELVLNAGKNTIKVQSVASWTSYNGFKLVLSNNIQSIITDGVNKIYANTYTYGINNPMTLSGEGENNANISFQPDQWMRYYVFVNGKGKYRFTIHGTSPGEANFNIGISLNDGTQQTISCVRSHPSDWNYTYAKDLGSIEMEMNPGINIIYIQTTQSMNFNHFKLERTVKYKQLETTEITVDATGFNLLDGQNAGYYDTTPNALDQTFYVADYFPVEVGNTVSNGLVVGVEKNEWLTYQVVAPETGMYGLKICVGGPYGFISEVSVNNKLRLSCNVTATGSDNSAWNILKEERIGDIYLSEGLNTIKFQMKNGAVNFDYFKLSLPFVALYSGETAGGNPLSDYTGGYVTAKAVLNGALVGKDASLIIALYKEDILQNIEIVKETVNPETVLTKTLTIPNNDQSNYKIKLYLWDDVLITNPYLPAYEYK